MPSRPRGGLGRGLEALIPQRTGAPPAEADGPSERTASVDDLRENPYQPRSSMDEEELSSLADSVRQHGVLQPLLVQREGDGLRLIAGHRRLEAAKLAGLDRVPVVVRERRDDENVLLLALVENLQRADLPPLDEAAAYRELSRRFGLSTEEIAQRTGKSRSAVANSVRLLDLSHDVKELLDAGKLTEGHARALLALRDRERQVAAANTVVEKELNVRQTEALVKSLLADTAASRPRRADPLLAELESSFRDRLGTKVSLSGSPTSGRLVIHYYSEEELGALHEAIVGGRP